MPARIVAKDPGSAWTWQVGPARLAHRVVPRGEGCLVAVDLSAPGSLEPALAAGYGPVVGLMVRRLARAAERAAAGANHRGAS